MPPRCWTKFSWPSFAAADGHRLALVTTGRAHDPARLHAYLCGCGAYHVGHSWRVRDGSDDPKAMTSAVVTFGSIGDGYSRRKC